MSWGEVMLSHGVTNNRPSNSHPVTGGSVRFHCYRMNERC